MPFGTDSAPLTSPDKAELYRQSLETLNNSVARQKITLGG